MKKSILIVGGIIVIVAAAYVYEKDTFCLGNNSYRHDCAASKIAAKKKAGQTVVAEPPSVASQDNNENTPPPTDGGPRGIMRVAGNFIYMADQRPGTQVKATSLFTEKPGFVVIHESNGDKAGAVIGVSKFLSAEENNGVVISLSRPVIQGEKFIAMLHEDNGDGKFNASNDPEAKTRSDVSVETQFVIDANAPENPVINF